MADVNQYPSLDLSGDYGNSSVTVKITAPPTIKIDNTSSSLPGPGGTTVKRGVSTSYGFDGVDTKSYTGIPVTPH